MKQMRLRELVFKIDMERQRFGRERRQGWVTVVGFDAALIQCCELLLGAECEDDFGAEIWPPVWVQVERESWTEVEKMLGEEEGEFSQEDYVFEFPYEVAWIGFSFSRRKQLWMLNEISIEPLEFDSRRHKLRGAHAKTKRQREALREYVEWLSSSLLEQLSVWDRAPEAYAAHLESALPKRHRMGKLLRRDLWSALPNEQLFLRDELTKKEVSRFVKLAPSLVFDDEKEKGKPRLSSLTRNQFLEYCSICYQGARYKEVVGQPLLKQYERMADGRHDGLLDLPGDSSKAFAEWLDCGSRGGHPWEIARGGNSTHISLGVVKDVSGYRLVLAGSARTRASETIRMALALSKARVPFDLIRAVELSRMATGEDWIGIVPEGESARYAEGLFPEEDEIVDVMSYASVAESPAVIEKIVWYPIQTLKHKVGNPIL